MTIWVIRNKAAIHFYIFKFILIICPISNYILAFYCITKLSTIKDRKGSSQQGLIISDLMVIISVKFISHYMCIRFKDSRSLTINSKFISLKNLDGNILYKQQRMCTCVQKPWWKPNSYTFYSCCKILLKTEW